MAQKTRAEILKNQLLAEWPDLCLETVEEDGLTLRLYGARSLFADQLRRANDLRRGQNEVELEVIESVTCPKSLPIRLGREIGEPAGNAARFVDEDGRGVALMCNNEDGHSAHDWGDYEPLPRQPVVINNGRRPPLRHEIGVLRHLGERRNCSSRQPPK